MSRPQHIRERPHIADQQERPVLARDRGAQITVETDPPGYAGWVVVVVERAKRSRRFWLCADEAAQLHAALTAVLPPVEVRQVQP